MSKLYENIMALCAERGIRGATLCAQVGISKSTLTDLKMGRKKGLSAQTANAIAQYFGVGVDTLLGDAPVGERRREVSPEDIKFALFGGDGEITDEMYEEVRQFAAFVKARERKK